MSFDFFQDLVSTAFVFVLHVQDRVDEMLAPKRPEPVLPANPGENRAVSKGRLAIEVKLGGPPCGRPVFELHPIGMKVVAAALRAEGREILNLQVPRFLKVVIVGHKVGILLSRSEKRKEKPN